MRNSLLINLKWNMYKSTRVQCDGKQTMFALVGSLLGHLVSIHAKN